MATSVSIIGTAVTGWRNGIAAISKMPRLMGVALALHVVIGVLSAPLMTIKRGAVSEIASHVLTLPIGIIASFVLAPVAIAVHRYVLLGEITPRWAVSLQDRRLIRFFLFTVVLDFLAAIPGSLLMLSGKSSFLNLAVEAMLFVGVVILAVGMVILFPAIAVDAPGADWRHALRDSKGHFWLVILVTLAAIVPLLVGYVPIFWLLLWPSGSSVPGAIVMAVAQSAAALVAIAVLAAVASRLYLAFADELGRPPNLQPLPA